MCTAVSWQGEEHYFGRNLDLEYSYEEQVVVTPRNFFFPFRAVSALPRHYALIGVAYVREGYPLYYDATNEKGLAMAGLNFPGYAVYGPYQSGKENVAPFELIPWVLGQCATVREARELLGRTNLLRHAFSPELPLTPLHWMLADREGCVVLEWLEDGLHLHENGVGVLTNAPPFDHQLTNLSQYLHLTPYAPQPSGTGLRPLSRGTGAVGLPGDLSSQSRFVRAAFTKGNSVAGAGESSSVAQFFHILDSVTQTRGCVRLEDGSLERTVYSSCINTDRGIYYYKTYENSALTAVDLHREDLEGRELAGYPLRKEGEPRWEKTKRCRESREKE